MTSIPFTNFTKGELAPELQARIDVSQYGAGAKKVRNFIIQRHGGLAFRPGFRLVGEADDPVKNIRYIPFQYNMEQAYIMALEDERMRLLTAGGMLSENNLKITAITKAASGVATVAYHGFAIGDRIFFDGITGMTELNGRNALVTGTSASTFTFNINTTTFGTFVSSTGIVRGSTPAPAPTPPPKPTPPPPNPQGPPPDVVVVGGSGYDTYTLPFNHDYVRPEAQ